MAAELPTYLKIEYVPDGQAKSAFLNDLDGTLKSAEQKFSEFSSEARRQLDTAISVPRNNVGSLDLGVPQLRAAAAAQEARAIAAREVAQATALAAKEEGDYGQQARLTVAAVQALAKEEAEAAVKARIHADAVAQVQQRLDRQKSSTDLLTQSTRAGTTAQQSVVNSARASRVAYVQLGQQMTDVTVQAQMGTSAFTIFAQQVPQAAFALSGLANSANATQATIGRFATFLSGPWGAAIFAATAVLGPFIYRLFEAEGATKKAEFATYAFGDAQSILGNVMDLTTGKINTQSEALLSLARAQAVAGQIEARRQQAEARSAFSDITSYSPQIESGPGGGLSLRRSRSTTADIIEAYREGSVSLKEAERGLKSLWETGLATEEQYLNAAEAVTKFAVAGENIKVFENLDAALGGDKSAIAGFLKPETAKKIRDNSGELARLAEFGEDAAKKIANIEDRFADIPSGVAASNRAVRELDDIISDLESRKPEGFSELVDKAERLKEILPSLELGQAYREIVEDSERRLSVQGLLVAGLDAEANTIQTIWNLERDFGPMAWDHLEAILAQERAEKRISEELRDRQQLVSYYLDATRSVRSELEAIFSGNGSLAGFGDIVADLQSKVLVDQIFGNSLKQLDDLVEGRSGVTTNIDFLAVETKRAGIEIGGLADVMAREAGRISSPSATTAPTQSAFDRAFAEYAPGGIANDNWDELIVQGKATADAVKVGALALTPADYADLMAKAIADPLLAKLDETFGTEFLAQLSGVFSAALSGYITGGEAGGVLGGLKGLAFDFGPDLFGKAITDKLLGGLDAGLQGAQTGTLFNAIFGGSKSGSQIGGAVGGIAGSILPGVGTLIGSIVGSAIGSLFGGGAKYGYASSTGGVGGNNDEAKSAAGQLGSALEDSIAKIADALGAEIGSYATSIGVTDGKYRISTTGRTGELKSKYSDVQVFGEGEAAAQAALQAAIADAIRDGAIQGLSPAALRLIQAADNIDAAIQDVIDFQSVFTRLQERQDPLGAALSKLDDEFEHLADVFTKAGASAEEWAQLDQLYQLERTDTIKREIEALTSSLRPLYQSLTVGNSALPLRERQALAEVEYGALAGRVAAGDTSAYDDYAEAARTLLEIERELYGSQQGYFDRLAEVTSLTKAALDYSEAQTQASIANSDDPTSPNFIPANDNQGVVDAISLSNSQLAAVNANIGTTNALLRQMASATGTGPVDYF